jgi:hypothetical protein
MLLKDEHIAENTMFLVKVAQFNLFDKPHLLLIEL